MIEIAININSMHKRRHENLLLRETCKRNEMVVPLYSSSLLSEANLPAYRSQFIPTSATFRTQRLSIKQTSLRRCPWQPTGLSWIYFIACENEVSDFVHLSRNLPVVGKWNGQRLIAWQLRKKNCWWWLTLARSDIKELLNILSRTMSSFPNTSWNDTEWPISRIAA